MFGEVISYSDFRGYGFIRDKGGQSYFVHVSNISRPGLKTLDVGEKVSFDTKKSHKGIEAVDVRVVSAEKDSDENLPKKLVFKKIPFTPQDPVTDASKFAGRKEAIYNSIDNLYNGKNILITGPRGIGKSSLACQLLFTTQGEKDLLQKLGANEGEVFFNNISGDHRCQQGNSLYDIANGLITTLLDNMGKNFVKDTRTIKKEIDLKYFKFSIEDTEKKISPSDLSVMFVSEVEHILNEYGYEAHGITFLIDEVDQIDSSIDLASFLKACVEKFRLNYQKSISLIVAGVTGTITNLLTQHQSANRLFENIPLSRMNDDELREIILVTLKETGMKIDEDAIASIIKFSNNFPQPIHLIGYHAFRIDEDNCIGVDDVKAAIDHIVQKTKKQEFESRFNKLGVGIQLEMLRRFAQARFETVNINFLRSKLPHYNDNQIYGVIGDLIDKGIIEKQHRDVWKFTEPLFKIYIRWIFGLED